MEVVNIDNNAHGNQPIQHMLYLYNYAGQPWKGQQRIRDVMGKLYLPTPDGYCGDEDNGQTSAWYVFSAMGFYPVTPGADEYILGTPLFRDMTVHLENGKDIRIQASNNSAENVYVDGLKLNGKPYTKNFVTFDELIKGADLNFTMSATPNTARGTKEEDRPYSFSKEK